MGILDLAKNTGSARGGTVNSGVGNSRYTTPSESQRITEAAYDDDWTMGRTESTDWYSQNPYKPTDWFGQKYASNITGLAKANNIQDYNQARDMLMANLLNGGQYQGGGVLDYNVGIADARRYNSEQQYMQTTNQPTQTTPQFDTSGMIKELSEAQRRQRIAALDKAKNSALGSLDTEQSSIAPYYYDKRNQAAAQSDIAALNFAQYMGAHNIKGKAGGMPEIYRNAGLQNSIGMLNRDEAARNADIERRRSGINTAYESDVVAANADIDAQSLQAFINQMNADRTFNAAQRQAEFDRQMKEWSVNPNNPEVQATILANKKRELDLAAQEIQNSYLPDTLKLEAQRLQQQVTAGYLDIDTARAKLEQIKNNPVNINDIIRQIDSLYVYKDPNSGENRINTNGLRAYILSLNLPDTQTDQLLMRYGI